VIKEISIKGFKSFVNTTLNLNKLTLLTGLNSSGKSSVIQALRMLERAGKTGGSFLLPGHGSIEELRNDFAEQISLEAVNDQDKLLSLAVSSSAGVLARKQSFDFPGVIYISASRFGPRTSIPIYNESSARGKLGENGENVLQCIEQYENTVLDGRLRHPNSEGDTLGYNIRGWLSIISPNVGFVSRLERITDSSYATFDGHRASNVGFGLSYTLPVITALLVGTFIPDSLVIVENPEAHLHPKGQTEMARLIALCSQAGAQIIVETHSDHLFDGIRIAARQYKMAKDIQLYWFELDKNKNTRVYSPVLTDDGRIDEWPEGFFDQFEINSSQLI
jgi:predicted ATPase